MNEDERAGRRRDPQQAAGRKDVVELRRAQRREEHQRAQREVQPDGQRHRREHQAKTAEGGAADSARHVVEQHHPDEVAQRSERHRHRVGSAPDGGDHRPDRGSRAGGQQELLRAVGARAGAPQDDRRKGACRERVAPKGDQPVHGRPAVKFADMSTCVAKLYKQVVNACAIGALGAAAAAPGRRGSMIEKRPIGDSGITVAPLALGGNVFDWTADEAASFAVIDAFVDAGGTMIDTADVYSAWVPGHKGGESEALIGRWLKRNPGKRDKVVIATKVGFSAGLAPEFDRAGVRCLARAARGRHDRPLLPAQGRRERAARKLARRVREPARSRARSARSAFRISPPTGWTRRSRRRGAADTRRRPRSSRGTIWSSASGSRASCATRRSATVSPSSLITASPTAS